MSSFVLRPSSFAAASIPCGPPPPPARRVGELGVHTAPEVAPHPLVEPDLEEAAQRARRAHGPEQEELVEAHREQPLGRDRAGPRVDPPDPLLPPSKALPPGA